MGNRDSFLGDCSLRSVALVMQFSVYLRFRVYDRRRPVVVGGLVVGGRPRPEAAALTPKQGPNPTMLWVHGTLFSSEDVF